MKKHLLKNITYLVLIVIFTAVSTNTVYSIPTSINKVQNQEVTVYITKTGAKYHRSDCGYLKKSKIAITKDKAINSGYSACSRCRP